MQGGNDKSSSRSACAYNPRVSHRVALLGPRAAGKSSVGRLLAHALGWTQHSVDEQCWGHYRELAEVRELEALLALEHGVAALDDHNRRRYLERLHAIGEREHDPAWWWRLWDRMRLHAALRCLAHAGPVIVDLGAGHARFGDAGDRAALDDALRRCDVAIWLQPWAEPARAAECLAKRLLAVGAQIDRPALVRACEPSQRPSAAELVLTQDRTSEAVAKLLRDRIHRLV